MIRPPPKSPLFPYPPLSRSDAVAEQRPAGKRTGGIDRHHAHRALLGAEPDRKSTRLNSSHSQISYAVFCLKKKKTQIQRPHEDYLALTHHIRRLCYYIDTFS